MCLILPPELRNMLTCRRRVRGRMLRTCRCLLAVVLLVRLMTKFTGPVLQSRCRCLFPLWYPVLIGHTKTLLWARTWRMLVITELI